MAKAHTLQDTYQGPVIDNGLHIGPCIQCKNNPDEKKAFNNFLQSIEFADVFHLYGRCVTTVYHIMVHETIDKIESHLWKMEFRLLKDLQAISQVQWDKYHTGEHVANAIRRTLHRRKQVLGKVVQSQTWGYQPEDQEFQQGSSVDDQLDQLQEPNSADGELLDELVDWVSPRVNEHDYAQASSSAQPVFLSPTVDLRLIVEKAEDENMEKETVL